MRTLEGTPRLVPTAGARPFVSRRSLSTCEPKLGSMPTPAGPLDHDALRAKYRGEREKRLRADGNDQFIEISGRFAHYLDDPYVPVVAREPLTDDVTVAVIGGGWPDSWRVPASKRRASTTS